MKKKILFVMESLRIGGAEKSLITILSLIDKKKYDISLYLFCQSGEFMNQIPKEVNVINLSEDDKLKKNFKIDWFTYLIKGKLKRSFYSFKWLVGCFVSKYIKREEEYIGWKNKKHLYSDILDEYDVAIGFLEKYTTYYVIDHVKAKKKIAFMHTDYDSIPHDEKLDLEYYKRLDYLVVVSEHTGETMLKHFPFLEGKIKVIKNMVSPDLITNMAEEKTSEMENKDNILKIVTVGRLIKPKQIDTAVRVLSLLLKEGIEAEWFVIGEGEEHSNLEKLINELGLNDKFHLLGSKVNPYPYMKNCDIYVQPSKWEGYGITVAEAKVLCKPIITSDIPEFREQIDDGVTGIICEDEKAIVNAIKEIIFNKKKKEKLIENLKNINYDNKELKKLEEIL